MRRPGVHSQKAPSAKRCIKTVYREIDESFEDGQKAPSAKRCIKTAAHFGRELLRMACQKAPSAKRCIKTFEVVRVDHGAESVRKHRAPKGALRPQTESIFE